MFLRKFGTFVRYCDMVGFIENWRQQQLFLQIAISCSLSINFRFHESILLGKFKPQKFWIANVWVYASMIKIFSMEIKHIIAYFQLMSSCWTKNLPYACDCVSMWLDKSDLVVTWNWKCQSTSFCTYT